MTDSNNGKRRVTCKRPHPNPHIHELLMTLHREAVKVNSSLLPALEEAIVSFSKYPLPITSAADCAILKGFNKKLCDYIESQLNGQPSQNKKNKVGEYERGSEEQCNSDNDINDSHVKDFDPNSIDTDKATSSNIKGNKSRKIPKDNCPIQPKIRENKTSNTDNAVPKVKTVEEINLCAQSDMKTNETNNNNIGNGSVNNNTISKPYQKSFESMKKRSSHANCDSPVDMIPYESFNDPSALLGQWEWGSNNQLPKTNSHKTKDCLCPMYTFKPVETVNNDYLYERNIEKEKNLIVEIGDSPMSIDANESEDEAKNKEAKQPTSDQWESNSGFQTFPENSREINYAPQYSQWPKQSMPKQTQTENNDNNYIRINKTNCYDVESCSECSSISNAANEFETSFKEKLKKDSEEIEKCILPRKLCWPDYRSPSYALLIALLEQRTECPYRISLTKEELIQKAQKHTDQSFTKPEIDSYHTAWTHAQKLVAKGMIEITNNDGEDYYKLTTMGRAVAMELDKDVPQVTVNDVIFHNMPNDRVPSLEDIILSPPPVQIPLDEGENSDPLFIEMPPGTFDIIMLIDKREQFEPSKSHKCKNELRSLTVGDFIWVARSKKTGQELVLPYIVERKRMDDLASSIKDGRFHEQKFRLRRLGLKNIIYVIESHGKNKNVGLPMSTLKQAMANTRVQDDFTVVNTVSLSHTFQYLGKMSDRLGHDYLSKHLRGSNRDTCGKELMTFEYFNKTSSKNKPLSVKETFIKMLLQLKGLSVEKALAITNKYSTPMTLMKAYDRCTEREGELLLASLKYNKFSRNVGPVISKTVYQLFSKSKL